MHFAEKSILFISLFVTDLEWYQIGVGLTVKIGVDAFTGNLGEKYVLVDCSSVQVDETSWSDLKALYRDP